MRKKDQEAAQYLQKVVQGKCPLHFHSNGVVCSNTLFSNASALTNSLLSRANSTCKVLEQLVWSNTSGLQFRGPLARTNFLSALCGLRKRVLLGIIGKHSTILLNRTLQNVSRARGFTRFGPSFFGHLSCLVVVIASLFLVFMGPCYEGPHSNSPTLSRHFLHGPAQAL